MRKRHVALALSHDSEVFSMPIAAERRVASYIVEGALFVAFTVGLYFASLEAYGIRLYALKTFGAPGGRI